MPGVNSQEELISPSSTGLSSTVLKECVCELRLHGVVVVFFFPFSFFFSGEVGEGM